MGTLTSTHATLDPPRAVQERHAGYVELFFDVVFVFAFTQVAELVAEEPSAAGLARAAVLFGLVWLVWSAYAWLTNSIDVEDGGTRLIVFGAALASFFMALALPHAYTHEGAWFAIAYFVARVAQIGLFFWGARGDPQMTRAVVRVAPWFLFAPSVAFVGGLVDDPLRTTLWTASIAIDVAGVLIARGGFRVSPRHFAERHALIVIIALGESIVAVGAGAEVVAHDVRFALAVVVAFAGAVALWWAHFSVARLAAERALEALAPESRGHFARDVYTFCHCPMVLGIVLLAVAGEKTIAAPAEPLSDGGRAVLAVGFALFVLGGSLARLRAMRRVAWERIFAALAVIVAVLLLADVDSLALLTVSVVMLIGALAAESIRSPFAAVLATMTLRVPDVDAAH
jgi:low temperature requirement protein LtrA